MTPTKRSLDMLRAEGWMVAVVEHWNPYAKIRQDLFGFADLLAVKRDEALLVQVTTGANMSARIAKVDQCQAAALWLECPTRSIEVHGWAKRGARGKRKTWTCRRMMKTDYGWGGFGEKETDNETETEG